MDSRAFLDAVMLNPFNRAILERLSLLGVPQAQLVAGCLFQTVWNVQAGRPPEQDIKDYDLFYFDDRDLSYDAEDRVIRAAADLFADLPVRIEVRNQARVHLWYEQHFGIPCPVLTSARAGIDRFLILATCFGLAPRATGSPDLYAPHGFDDVVRGVLRPNPANYLPDLFEAKARTYQARWPWLTIAAGP